MKKHIPALIWIVSAVFLVVYIVRANAGVDRSETAQIVFRFLALYVADLGLAAHTVVHKEDNSSNVNYGYKLLAELVIFLAITVALLKIIFF